MFSKILGYLKQPSTLRGLIGLLGIFGVAVSPEQSASIITATVSLIAAIEVFRNEKK
jgi:hypothetical protein